MRETRLMKLTVAASLGILVGVMAAQAQSDTSGRTMERGQLSESDYRFALKAARGGMEEVDLGQIALQRGTSQAVRDFGQRMVTDHTKANERLRQVATQKGASLPPTLSRTGRSQVDELQKLNGAEFDRTYAKKMVKDHKEDVREFEKGAKDVSDPDLRAWAQETLPVLQQHLQLAQEMEGSIKAEK